MKRQGTGMRAEALPARTAGPQLHLRERERESSRREKGKERSGKKDYLDQDTNIPFSNGLLVTNCLEIELNVIIC